ncbi:MAG: hypothetical protein MO846_03050 [Candidatus Devosia symbiotica]|nr:hypothetical protein [Candidatus Devosia symbiotica]
MASSCVCRSPTVYSAAKYDKDTHFAETDHRNYNADGKAFLVGKIFSGVPFARGVELVAEPEGLALSGMKMSQFALPWILDHP